MLVNKDIAEKAVDIVRPMILGLIQRAQEHGVYVVIMAGNHAKENDTSYPVIFEESIEYGDEYKEVAIGKAKVSWRTGSSSKNIAERFPILLESGDSVYSGGYSAIIEDVCVSVGTSGLSEIRDELVSLTIINTINSLMDECVVKAKTGNNGFIK